MDHEASSKSRRAATAIALAVALVAGSAVALVHSKNKTDVPLTAAPKEIVYELAKGDLATVEARPLSITLPVSGSLEPLAQATVKSKVSGLVLESPFKEGMHVAAGQVIARLDTADQRARVAQQRAALDEANARLSLARKNNANSRALLRQNFISQSSYDATENNVQLAQAAVDAARAQLDLVRIALADATIRAPLSGVVSKRYAQAGDKLAPDSPVLDIVDLGQLTLQASVPASDIPRVKVGQPVRFSVDGYGERAFAGKVARISPTTETGSRALIVYVSVANGDGALRGGMFAKGEIVTEQSAPHALVPLAALRKDGARDVVYRIERDRLVEQPVRLGLRNDDQGVAEVTDGLPPGAVVVAVKLDGVKPGSRVKVAQADVPSPAKG